MMKSAILFAFVCSITIPVVFCVQCDEKNCIQACTPQNCTVKFDCGRTREKCSQFCLGQSSECKELTCANDVKDCKQTCQYCPTETKLICSSEKCVQLCNGTNCDMECTENVKVCEQLCGQNSICKMTCPESAKCTKSCPASSKCTFAGKQPLRPPSGGYKCDDKKCVKNCTSSCKDKTLECEQIESCSLACKDGCTMVCKETVKECKMDCIGQSSCKMECNAKSCSKYQNGKAINVKSPTSAGPILHSQTFYVLVLGLLVLNIFVMICHQS